MSRGTRVGVAGAAVVGVAFGMVRYAFGVTLPDVRAEFAVSDLLLGIIASGSFTGYLAGLLLAMPLAARMGPRAPTTAGGVCAAVGCVLVAVSTSPLPLAAGAVLAGTSAGWAWAPYSEIVPRVAPPHRRARLLALVNTGTSAGFLLLALLIVAASLGSWRVVWFGTGAVAAAAALLNLWFVPRLGPRATPSVALGSLRRPAMRAPLGYAVAYSAGCTIFFTYASQSISNAGLPRAMGAALFVAVAVSGVSALWSDRMCARLGTVHVAALCVAAQGIALVVLAAARGSVVATVASSLVYGFGYMVGGAVLAIWTAQVLPEAPGDGFSAALVVGAVSAIVAPTVIGALTSTFGLSLLLVAAGALAVASGVWLSARSLRSGRPRAARAR